MQTRMDKKQHDKISLKKFVAYFYSAKNLEISNVNFQSKKMIFSKESLRTTI
jgi:hypothetical protein